MNAPEIRAIGDPSPYIKQKVEFQVVSCLEGESLLLQSKLGLMVIALTGTLKARVTEGKITPGTRITPYHNVRRNGVKFLDWRIVKIKVKK